ncbi:MAG: hypothetical protein IJ794_09695 [Lachnospiraceae bacterium]|nr:hypothetical protein [Lachnospiraceae bacterium]
MKNRKATKSNTPAKNNSTTQPERTLTIQVIASISVMVFSLMTSLFAIIRGQHAAVTIFFVLLLIASSIFLTLALIRLSDYKSQKRFDALAESLSALSTTSVSDNSNPANLPNTTELQKTLKQLVYSNEQIRKSLLKLVDELMRFEQQFGENSEK